MENKELDTIKEFYWNIGYEAGYRKAVDKACEWMRKNINMPTNELNFTIWNFQKAMEE